MPTEYHDPDIGEMGEWVAISTLTGRKFYAPIRRDAEQARDEDDRIFSRHHQGGLINWVIRPDQLYHTCRYVRICTKSIFPLDTNVYPHKRVSVHSLVAIRQ